MSTETMFPLNPPIESPVDISDRRTELVRACTMSEEYQKDKAIFILRFSLWSGLKVQSDDELSALGITDVKEYKKRRNKGSKELVSRGSLAPIYSIKTTLERALAVKSRRLPCAENVYFVSAEKLDDVILETMDAEKRLREEVDLFIMTKYEREKNESIAIFMKDSPGMSEALFHREFPSDSAVKGKFGVRFMILRTPVEAKLSELANEYQLKKLEEGTKEFIEETGAKMRGMLVKVLTELQAKIREKGGEQKINQRTIRAVEEVFGQFREISTMFGDRKISDLVSECTRKFELATSWTVEEVKSLGIEDAIRGVVAAASDEVTAMTRQQEFIDSMFVVDEEENFIVSRPDINSSRRIDTE